MIRRLAMAVDDLGPLAAPSDVVVQLTALCATVRTALSAASCSIARLDSDALEYVAADGAGAEQIIGVRLPLTRGIASYVARTGQALAVDTVTDDPRFARDVAQRTGYVPTSVLAVPVSAADGEVAGVLSVLDRTPGDVDALEVASTAATQASLVLPTIDVVVRLGPVIVRALARTVDDVELADALRAEADVLAQGADEDDDGDVTELLVRVTGLLAELRVAGSAAVLAAERILHELVALNQRRP
ncbi:MAG: GAF domain-containing protein [Ilumatobacteraceae bacterium]